MNHLRTHPSGGNSLCISPVCWRNTGRAEKSKKTSGAVCRPYPAAIPPIPLRISQPDSRNKVFDAIYKKYSYRIFSFFVCPFLFSTQAEFNKFVCHGCYFLYLFIYLSITFFVEFIFFPTFNKYCLLLAVGKHPQFFKFPVFSKCRIQIVFL